MSASTVGGDGGGAMVSVGAIWGSAFTDPAIAESGKTPTTRIAVPSTHIGGLQPGDLIGSPGFIGDGGFGTKILRVLAGAGVVIVAGALVEDSVTHEMSKVEKKPCAQPGMSGVLNVTPIDRKKKSGIFKNFLVTCLIGFPIEPIVLDIGLSLVSPLAGVSAEWQYFAQGIGSIKGERGGWFVSPVGQGWEAYFLGEIFTGPNLNPFAAGGFDLNLSARVVWPHDDDRGHPVCDTAPTPLEASYTYTSKLVVASSYKPAAS